MPAHGLPRWAWLLPVAVAVAAVLAWGVWCDTETGTWLGGVLVVATGILVLALVREALPPQPDALGVLMAWGIAVLAGLAATGAVFVVAGLAYYLRCRPF